MIWGVLQFPGSCDERDALLACELHGDGARLIWHESRDLDGVDGVVVPGGFSYGDYLRAGAIARFSPAMEAVAEMAGGELPAGSHPALLRQAVRARLGHRQRLEQKAAGAGDPARCGRADAREIRRGLRADHRDELLVPRARVLIRPKEGILDPQGKAVERALPALGFEGVDHVHVGRLVELEVEDPERLGELCEKLLANPLIEDYEIQTL